MRRFRPIAVLSIVVALAVSAACGDSGARPAVSGQPVATTAPKPQRIVSLSPTATEVLFAIGAGSQVIAVDDQSNYPPTAPKTDLSGFEPNVEAIAGKKPDLVILSNDIAGIVAKLKTVGVTAQVFAAVNTLDEAYAQIKAIGDATGNRSGADAVVAKMSARVGELDAKLPKPAKSLRYYHELDSTLYSITSKTFIGDLYKRAGLQNVADAADKTGSGYPQLSAEYLVQQNPDLVFLADTKCCKESAKTFGARAGFATIAAVRKNGVVELDDDVASRWGPRTVDLYEAIVTAVVKASSTS